MEDLATFVRKRRKQANLTQAELADRAGVGLRFIRDLEQNRKASLRLDKVDQVLRLFGHLVGPLPARREGRE